MSKYQNTLNCILESNDKIKKNQKTINELKEENAKEFKFINSFTNDFHAYNRFKIFIADKLQEAIDKFHLNNGREDNDVIENIISSSSSNGDYATSTIKSLNPNSKFDPYNDEWEIVDIKYKDYRYKITVNNKKGIKYLTPFNYTFDEFSTDWFEA